MGLLLQPPQTRNFLEGGPNFLEGRPNFLEVCISRKSTLNLETGNFLEVTKGPNRISKLDQLRSQTGP